MKYLVVGLGNIGAEYADTRHNIGFMVLDRLAAENGAKFAMERYAYWTEIKCKGHLLELIKPTTYMNESGKAVRYWLEQEKIPVERCLVVVDDLALEPGQLRMKANGSAGGHNGLSNIEALIGTRDYPRLRFGIGNKFHKGQQIDYVLGKFSPQDLDIIGPRIDMACEMIKSFVLAGITTTMNQFNNK